MYTAGRVVRYCSTYIAMHSILRRWLYSSGLHRISRVVTPANDTVRAYLADRPDRTRALIVFNNNQHRSYHLVIKDAGRLLPVTDLVELTGFRHTAKEIM